MRSVVLLIAFALLVQAGLVVTNDDRARLDRALAAYDAGHPDEAEPELRDLARRYPNQFEIVETLGLIYAERDQVERAIPFLEAGYKASPTSPQAAANLGVACLKLNRIPQAVSALAHAAALDPANSETQSSYGHALMAANRPVLAAQAFSQAASHAPGNDDLLYNWALAAFSSGRAAQAENVLARIPEAARSASVESLCGDIEEKLGHTDRALACMQNAAKLDESEANLNALGIELLRHWSFDAAIKVFQYGVSKYPRSQSLRTGLGSSLYGSGQYSTAASVFSGLLVDMPTSSTAKLLGWSCFAIKAGSDEDCDALIRYATNHEGDAEADRLAAATILARHDEVRFPIARRLLTSATSADPHSGEGYYYVGVLDQEERNWAASVAALKQADALRHNSSKIHLRLALAYSHLGKPISAHDEAEIQRQLRQLEDSDMEAKRRDVRTFVLTMR